MCDRLLRKLPVFQNFSFYVFLVADRSGLGVAGFKYLWCFMLLRFFNIIYIYTNHRHYNELIDYFVLLTIFVLIRNTGLYAIFCGWLVRNRLESQNADMMELNACRGQVNYFIFHLLISRRSCKCLSTTECNFLWSSCYNVSSNVT